MEEPQLDKHVSGAMRGGRYRLRRSVTTWKDRAAIFLRRGGRYEVSVGYYIREAGPYGEYQVPKPDHVQDFTRADEAFDFAMEHLVPGVPLTVDPAVRDQQVLGIAELALDER